MEVNVILWVESILLASKWIICVIMLIYVPRRRSPEAARTWLLLVFFLPWIGLMLYLIFGRIYLPRQRSRIHIKAAQRIRQVQAQWRRGLKQLPKRYPDLRYMAHLVQTLGDLGVEAGNAIELLDEYDASMDRLLRDIDGARHSVHLQYYILADDDSGQAVEGALIRAAQRGVRCRVLMDSLGSRGALKTLAPRLRASGVDVLGMMPVGSLRSKTVRFDLRNHRKIAVIDGEIGYVGSQNIVNAEYKPGISYEDVVVRARGPVVSQLQVVFLADWSYESDTIIQDDKLLEPQGAAGHSLAQVLPSGPGYGRTNAQMVLVALIHGAQQRVVIATPYFVPDEPLLQAIETSVLRGVEVHLVVSEKADQVFVSFAQRSYYDQLLTIGVRIHLYRPRFLHAKHVSIDNAVALIGSSNVDIRSFALNSEVNLLVYDADVLNALRQIQERYFAHSSILTVEEWAKRPAAKRTCQSIARLANSIL